MDKIFKELNELETQEVVYHATRARFVNKIKKEGIRPKKRKSFEGQVGEGLIYFAYDDEVAASFVECADNIPEEWEDDKIVILAVKKNHFDKNYICKDPNILLDEDEEDYTFAYKLTVPPNEINILNAKENKIEPLLSIRKLSNKYYY